MQKILGLLFIVVCLIIGIWFGLYIIGDESRRAIKIGAIAPSKHHVTAVEGFRAKMAELDFDENSGDTFIFNGPSGRGPELKSAINELIRQQVDLIYVTTTPATLAVKQETMNHRIPVVFGPVNDPVAARIVETLMNPGGNITGITLLGSEDRRLELLKEIAPAVERIFVPFNAKDKSAQATLKQIKQAAPTLGLQLILGPVHNKEELSAVIATIPEAADAIFLPRDSMVGARLEDFGKVALERKLPLISASHSSRARGVLFGFGPDLFKIGIQAAGLAHRVLIGGDPSNFPVQSADNYLYIDLGTADAIGVNIPEYIIYAADSVIR